MPRVPHTLSALLLRIPFFFLLYLLLVDDLHEDELIMGAVVAVGAAVFSYLILAARQSLRVSPAMFRHLPSALLTLVVDAVGISWALLQAIVLRRPLHGHLRVARYRATSEQVPEDFGRRMLTQWGASLGANRYVIGIDNRRGLLIVHELQRSERPLDPLRLG